MPNTYVALRTETLVSAASSVTFNLSGISGYTDLVMVVQTRMSSAADAITYTLNGDTTGTNYSQTGMGGDGSSAYSYRQNLNTLGSINSTALSTIVINFQNYSNSTTFKTTLARTGSAAQDTRAIVSTWRNTAAVTSINLGTYSSTFVAGSTFSLYGIANADQGAAKATGGIITEDSQYWYHTFGASGAFVPKQSLTCDILQVAGGAGGGHWNGGGGGAGGVLYYASQSLTAISHNVTVGAGGPGSTNVSARGTNGNNSQFAALTASVGGGGGGSTSIISAASGGSGGGGSPQGGAGGANTSGQGFAGAAATNGLTPLIAGGGGGAGEAGNTDAVGFGGDGISTYSSWGVVTGIGQNINGTYWIAGGGAGGLFDYTSRKTGGEGGGGDGGTRTDGIQDGLNAVVLTGSGGGGGGYGQPSAGPGNGGSGGSGFVIVRYLKA